jgi:chemotaxis signal transduction protein
MSVQHEKAQVGLLLGERRFVVAVDRLVDVIRDPVVDRSGDGARPARCVVSWRGVTVHAIDLGERLGMRRSPAPTAAAIVTVAGRALGILAAGATSGAAAGAQVLDLRELLG